MKRRGNFRIGPEKWGQYTFFRKGPQFDRTENVYCPHFPGVPIFPARRLKVADRLGSVEGKTADLILVDGRPDRNVGDVREVVMVMKSGVILDVARLSAHVGMRPSSRLAGFEAAGRDALPETQAPEKD